MAHTSPLVPERGPALDHFYWQLARF